MIIPFEQLSSEALQGVIEAFITREGTDYGQHEFSLTEKATQVMKQLQQGDVVIAFDPVSEDISLVLRREVEQTKKIVR